mgnify:CR=1 FL=1
MTAEKPRAFTDTPQCKIMRTLVVPATPLVRCPRGPPPAALAPLPP